MRGRNRSNKGPNPLTRSYESNGPDVKIRGTAQHVAEKYSQLARDALASGDPVAAENYYQHAEHYIRIIAAAQEQLREQYGYQQRFDEDGDEEPGFAGDRGYGEDMDPGAGPQPFEPRPEGEGRPQRFDRGDRQERGDRGDRPDRGDRQDRGDRRERFQRDRGPRQDNRQDGRQENRQEVRQDFNRDSRDGEGRQDRSERQERPERQDRPERQERPDRGEFRRDRRRDEVEPDAAALPAFLTNPVRTIAVEGGEGEAPVESGMNAEGGEFRARRPRRRRARFGEGGEAEGGPDFAPEPVETPPAE
ncbi:MAG TPA: DUF4167 domain-containing protein [Microvirga sp.]|jgi:hypothetical protein